MKLTRHNGRSGKHGAYNPKHNDRSFEVENSEHIDGNKIKENIYWNCYQGLYRSETKDGTRRYSFEEVERLYYIQNYSEHIQAQNDRNEKARHPERNRKVEDLLKNNKTCPEESIYQIGTIEETLSGETLVRIAVDFFKEMEQKYGEHFHIIDWALHMDEGTPHIHERHVFDCENKYGELCPQQEKALEKLGVPLPHPDKKKGRNNNRKQTFDADCRELLFEICQKYGVYLDKIPSYGGRAYLEKQDYILEKQKMKLAETRQKIVDSEQMILEQEQKLEELSLKIADVESIVYDVAEEAYEKACATVTDTVRKQTQQEDINMIAKYMTWLSSSERKAAQNLRDYAIKHFEKVTDNIKNSDGKLQATVIQRLQGQKERNMEQLKDVARKSIKEKLQKYKLEVEKREEAKKQSNYLREKKQNMEL